MNRRSFLKAVTLAVGATFVPLSLSEALAHQVSSFSLAGKPEFSGFITVSIPDLTDQNHPAFVKSMEIIREQVKASVPAGTPFLVTVAIGADPSDPLNQTTAIRWIAPAIKTPEREHFIGIFLS